MKNPLPALAETLKSVAKLVLHSRLSARVRPVAPPCGPLYILANGPSLRKNLDEDSELLQHADTLAVNFAANQPEFRQIKPKYYVLADPHFFENTSDPNVARLIESLRSVDWPMTLFVPASAKRVGPFSEDVKTQRFNFVGVEGFAAFERWAMRHALAMPRPRNVLIPSIMIGIWLGYKEIYLLGADHTWTQTLDVDDDNQVVTVQPHFYKDDAGELHRQKGVYLHKPLHELLDSFAVAFRSYHHIRPFADSLGVSIYNATPGSFIDAFPRHSIRE